MRQGAYEAAPTFFLYGEPVRDAGERFLHVEDLARRTRPANWTILPHAHATLTQLLALSRGGGHMRAGGVRTAFAAPCLLVIPSGVVHEFAFEIGTGGQVLTVGDSHLRDLVAREPTLAGLFDAPAAVGHATPREARHLDLVLRQLAAESAWSAPGREAALDSLLTLVLVALLRALGGDAGRREAGTDSARLVARFRLLVEQRFRSRPRLSCYLDRLGVTEGRLRRACAEVARQTPAQMIAERTILEARRMMRQSNVTSAEVSARLGFDDPAYFSRFFRARTGESARSFRRTLPREGAAEAPGRPAAAGPAGGRANRNHEGPRP